MRLLGHYLNSQTETKKIRDLCERAAAEHVERCSASSMRAPQRLNKDENERIAALYAEGTKVVEIARLMKISEWTVHHRLNRMGIERRPTGPSPSQIDEATRLYEQGESVREIQRRIGFSENTIRKVLRKSSVEMQNQLRKN